MSAAATNPCAVWRKPRRSHPFLGALAIPHSLAAKQKGGRSLCRPASLERTTYFRLVIAVRSAENLAMPAAPHQLEPKPPGLIGVKLPSNLAV
jgi:hypothetical protein